MTAPPEADDGRRVLRNPSTLRSAAVLVPSLVVLGLWDGTTPGLWYGGAVVIALFTAWPRVILDSGGVTVVNVVSRRCAWNDITGVEWRSGSGRAGLCLVLSGGTRVWAWGAMVGQAGGYEWARAVYRDVEARWREASERRV